MQSESKRTLWRQWVIANGVAELLGLGIVAGAAALLIGQVTGEVSGRTALGVALGMVLLGAVEGLVVGAAQWLVLKRRLHALAANSWVGATVAGAVIAWILGGHISQPLLTQTSPFVGRDSALHPLRFGP